MTIAHETARQYPLSVSADFDLTTSTLLTGVAQDAITLPTGVIVIGGTLQITTAFDSVTSDAIDVTGGGTVLAAADAQVLGSSVIATTGVATSVDTEVTVEWTGVGGSETVGAGRLTVDYIVVGRENEHHD